MRIFRKNVLLVACFCLLHLFGYSQRDQGKLDSLATYTLSNFEEFVTFRENFSGISKRYIQQFKNLFETNALIINCFEGKIQTVQEYIDNISRNFPAGISCSLEEVRVIGQEETSNNQKILKILAFAKFSGYNRKDEKLSRSLKLNINLIYLETIKQFKISSISEYFIPPIEVIKVQLVDLQEINSGRPGIELRLIIADSIFQSSVSNRDGMVQFFGIPGNSNFTITLTPGQQLFAKSVTVYTDEGGFDADKIIFIPYTHAEMQHQKSSISSAESTRWGVEFFLIPALSHLILQDTNNPDINLMNLKQRSGFGYYSGLNLSNNIWRNNKYDFTLNFGWQIQSYRYSLKVKEFISIHAQNTPNDGEIIKIVASNLLEDVKILSFAIPLSFRLNIQSKKKYLNTWVFQLSTNFLIPVINDFEMKGDFKLFYSALAALQTDKWDKTTQVASIALNRHVQIREKLNVNPLQFQLTGAIGVNFKTGFDRLTIYSGIITALNHTGFLKEYRRGFLAESPREYNPLSSVISKGRIIQTGLSLSVNYKFVK